MNKKKVIIILILIAIAIILISTIMFTGLGREMIQYLHYRIKTPKETITLEEQDHIKITYTYRWQEESFDIDVTDKELIKLIKDNISNKKLNNYSGQIGLAVMGEYCVDLGNNIKFKFDNYDDDGFVMMFDNDTQFLTKINPQILSKVVDIVDIKLTEKVAIFKTNKITITNNKEKQINIERKTAIEYILNQCKNVYTKEMDYELSIVAPDYRINFNNGVEIFKYKQSDRGFLLKDGMLYEAYGIEGLDTILENAFDNIKEKEQMFNTDKIIITSPNKEIEITDKETIEKITTTIVYSKIQEKGWLDDYNIKEEYDNGIKIKINDYEFLIPGKVGSVTIGNRYIISANKKISLCFTLQDLEQYANELLGNKLEKPTGLVTIEVPSNN